MVLMMGSSVLNAGCTPKRIIESCPPLIQASSPVIEEIKKIRTDYKNHLGQYNLEFYPYLNAILEREDDLIGFCRTKMIE